MLHDHINKIVLFAKCTFYKWNPPLLYKLVDLYVHDFRLFNIFYHSNNSFNHIKNSLLLNVSVNLYQSYYKCYFRGSSPCTQAGIHDMLL